MADRRGTKSVAVQDDGADSADQRVASAACVQRSVREPVRAT